MAADNRHNPYTRDCQTGPSRMDVRLLSFPGSLAEDNVICYVFEPKKHGKTVRKELSLKQLMHKMNEKGRGLEFLSAYQGYDSVILECVLDWKKKPYNRECVLILSTNDIVYRWNDFTVYNN